jgi:Cu(I)/Ag(I) efflux system membrane fusion protein
MKKLLLSALALAVIAGGTALRASDALKEVVGSYLEIQAALASDKFEGVKPAATALAARAEAMGESGAAMARTAKTVAAAADLKAARDSFGPLTDAVVAAAKADGWKDLGDVKLAYCPMVKQSWLQKEDKIRNPYYGTAMSGCGEFRKP